MTAPAAVINKVFDVTLQQYQHPTENRLFYAPDAEPAVELDTPVSQITGLDNFRTPRRAPNLLKAPRRALDSPPHAGGSGNAGLYTGGDFRAAYAPGVTLTGNGQAVGILELDGYIASDIKTYEQKNGIPAVPLQNVYLAGYTGGNPNEESAADIELVISMAPGIAKAIIYGVPYNNPAILDALTEMANPTQAEPLPYQITTSYYFPYDKNVYDALARLAVQGQALFVASGDYGSYNETTGSGDFPPADHPLVTSVGGTELQTSGPGGTWAAETTASFSGGGYSPWGGDPQFAIPWWQAGMDYTASKGSNIVRNAPDVSMVAANITVFSNGGWNGFAGTSAAAPLWAGFMALANEHAAASGRPRVGFANPALWAIGRSTKGPTCFHDITTGNNFNGTNPTLYSAVAGYDLCTGWGTPNGKDLIDALVGYADWGALGPTKFVAASTDQSGQLHVLVLDERDGLWHTIRKNDGTWPYPWGDVQQQIRAHGSPDVGPTKFVAASTDQSGQLHVLVLDERDGLWHTIRKNDGTWPYPWGDVQQQIRAHGSPDVSPTKFVAASTDQSGQLHVLVLDERDGLWHTIRKNDGTWPYPWGDVQHEVFLRLIG